MEKQGYWHIILFFLIIFLLLYNIMFMLQLISYVI